MTQPIPTTGINSPAATWIRRDLAQGDLPYAAIAFQQAAEKACKGWLMAYANQDARLGGPGRRNSPAWPGTRLVRADGRVALQGVLRRRVHLLGC